jgi:hypothetical protein
MVAATAPLAIVKTKAVEAVQPVKFIGPDHNLMLEHNLYTFALHKSGDSKKAEEFVDWHQENIKYWLRELRKDPNFHKDPTKAAQLAQFEGQTFENLWKLYNSAMPSQ